MSKERNENNVTSIKKESTEELIETLKSQGARGEQILSSLSRLLKTNKVQSEKLENGLEIFYRNIDLLESETRRVPENLETVIDSKMEEYSEKNHEAVKELLHEEIKKFSDTIDGLIEDLDDAAYKLGKKKSFLDYKYAAAISVTAIVMSLGFNYFYPQKYVIDKDLAQSIASGDYVQHKFDTMSHKEFVEHMAEIYKKYGRDYRLAKR